MKIPVQKNKEYIVDIIDNGFEGEGIAKIDNFTIFVPGAIKGEKVKILIVKANKNFAFAKVIEIIEKFNHSLIVIIYRKKNSTAYNDNNKVHLTF